MNLKGKTKSELQAICTDNNIEFKSDLTNAELRDLITSVLSSDTDIDTNDIVVSDASLSTDESEGEVVASADIKPELPTESKKTWSAKLLSKGRWLDVDGEFESQAAAELAAKKRGGHCIKTKEN